MWRIETAAPESMRMGVVGEEATEPVAEKQDDKEGRGELEAET